MSKRVILIPVLRPSISQITNGTVPARVPVQYRRLLRRWRCVPSSPLLSWTSNNDTYVITYNTTELGLFTGTLSANSLITRDPSVRSRIESAFTAYRIDALRKSADLLEKAHPTGEKVI